MTQAEGYKPYCKVTPGRETSARQVVFALTLGPKENWPAGTVVDHYLDGVLDRVEVPPDQDDSPVYLVYHDQAAGIHDWEATIIYADGSQEPVPPFRWAIIEAPNQTPQAGTVELAGVAHASTGVAAQALGADASAPAGDGGQP